MTAMTSMQRVLTSLGHQEPDRGPFFLPATMHGARELGLTIREYLMHAENVVEGQSCLRSKYEHDCFSSFFYTSLELEAWGGETIFREDGPPNSEGPIVSEPDQILKLQAPSFDKSPCLLKVTVRRWGLYPLDRVNDYVN